MYLSFLKAGNPSLLVGLALLLLAPVLLVLQACGLENKWYFRILEWVNYLLTVLAFVLANSK